MSTVILEYNLATMFSALMLSDTMHSDHHLSVMLRGYICSLVLLMVVKNVSYMYA